MTTTRLTAIALCALALLLAACGGGGDGDDPQPAPPPPNADAAPQPPPTAEEYGEADPAPGEVLLRFVRAAGENDVDTMWELLGTQTRASLGPTLADFRTGTAVEFHEGLGSLAPTAKVILSRTVDPWGVAAVSGTRTVEGNEEFYAYGVALREEEGQLKLDLGGIILTQLKPEPQAETDAQPEIGASAGADNAVGGVLVWLDGEPLATERSGDTPFTATVKGKPTQALAPGRHVVVVFTSTSETAGAIAWPFTVEDS